MVNHSRLFKKLIFNYGFEREQVVPLCLKLPTLPSFIPNPQYFEVSDTNVTGQSISIATNNFATKGGGGGSAGTGVDGSCGYVAAYGSIGLSFNYDYSEGVFGVPGSFPFDPHTWGEFNGIPFAIGEMRVNTTNANLVWLCSAYLSNPATGVITIKRIGLNYLQKGTQPRVPRFSYRNGIYSAVVTVQDSVDNVFKILCIQWTSPNNLSFTSTPHIGTTTGLGSPNIYQDNSYIHVIIASGGGSPIQFDRFNAPDGTLVIENVTNNQTLASGVTTGGNNNAPVVLDGTSFLRQSNSQKFLYNNILNIVPSTSLRLRTRIENPAMPNTLSVLDTFADSNSGSLSGGIVLRRQDNSPIDGITDYVVFRSGANSDATFPHTNLAANNPQQLIYLIYRFKNNAWSLIASFSNLGIKTITGTEDSSVIFTSILAKTTLHKALVLSRQTFFYLTDLQTGSVVQLDNILPSGFLPVNSGDMVSSTPNYLLIYGLVQGQRKLIYLSFDR